MKHREILDLIYLMLEEVTQDDLRHAVQKAGIILELMEEKRRAEVIQASPCGCSRRFVCFTHSKVSA